jgi:LysM repeat protein/ABC-type branched-subunit amino acid transport system substrate-binding protein
MLLKIRIITIVFSLLQASVVYCQNKPSDELHKNTTVIKVVDGVKYYIHTVEKGETLYAISQKYNCTTNDVILENPQAMTSFRIGMTLLIPVSKTKKRIEPAVVKKAPDTANYTLYKVEKGQTLFAIAKKFNSSIEKISDANPELKNGLKADQILKIPKSASGAVVAKPKPPAPAPPAPVVVIEKKLPVTPIDTTRPKKAVYNPAPPTILPVSVNAKYGYPGEKKEEYNIAFFLPFHTSETEYMTIEKLLRGEEQFSNKTNIALQFYEGALIALDSLKKEHLNAKVFVYDIDDNDSLGIPKILKKPEIAEMDLIIGPLYASSFVPVAKFAKEHAIPIVSPFIQVNKILFDNPYVCKVTSSNTLQVIQMANFVVDSFYTQNIILVNSGNKKEADLCATFKRTIIETANNKMCVMTDSVKEAKGLTEIALHLHPTKTNVIILPSNNQSYVTEFINTLNTLQAEKKMVVFGLQSWMTFDNLDFDYLNKLSLHIVSNTHINYSDPLTKRFISKFRTTYKNNPDVYAFSGYDMTYYFASLLQKYGKGFLNEIDYNEYKGLVTTLQFIKSATSKSGYENKFVYMLKYSNYELVPAN